MAGRRTSLAALSGEKVDTVPGRAEPLLLSLPLDKVVPTRFNPRRRFGTEDELRDFGEKLKREQLQPAVVVSRAAYLKLWPEEAEAVADASYVIANGERRYRASLLVGRARLEVVQREDVAASRAAFLDAVQSENNDRENLDPIERALGIDIMVTQLGGANQVAVYYGKTDGWVSQQRKLLKLTPELQDLVASREIPVRVARDIAGLPHKAQKAAWEEEVARRQAEKEARARWNTDRATPAPEEALPPAARFTAVKNTTLSVTEGPAPVAVEGERFTAAKPSTTASGPGDYHAVIIPGGQQPQAKRPADAPAPAADTTVAPVPEPCTQPQPQADDAAGPVVPEGRKLPYDNGPIVGRHLALKMASGPFLEALMAMATECWDKVGEEATFDVLRTMLETAAEHDPKRLNELADEFLRRTDEGVAVEGGV